MRLKRFIFAVFLVMALSFTFQPAQAMHTKERHSIVYTIDYKDDNTTKELLDTNKKATLKLSVSLTLQILIIDRSCTLYDSS